MNTSEYTELDGLGLADLIRRKEVSAIEVLQAACTVVELANPQLNAVVDLFAVEAEQQVLRGLPDGPFGGVPFLVKDLGPTYANKRTSMGSRLFENMVAHWDSELMVRYRRAGLVTLGKTNLPELGLSFATEPALFGPCRNPWDLQRTPGGSSGGSAAAVAARMVPLAHGNDAGGSIRVPASACGLFGFKPTRGYTPTGPFAGEMVFGLGIDHALTRSVRDSAALLDATMGEDAGAPYAAPAVSRTFLAEATTPPGRLRIAVSDEAWNGAAVSPDCQAAVKRVAALCEELGHEVEPARPQVDWSMVRFAFDGLAGAFASHLLDVLCPRLGFPFDPTKLEASTLAIATHGRSLTGTMLATALGLRDTLARTVGQFFTKFDVLLTPTLASPPPLIGELALNRVGVTAAAVFDQLFSFAPFTALFNLTGTPAMSVPLHTSQSGLPVGVQFAGRFGADAVLFRLAGQLEQVAPWEHRRPCPCLSGCRLSSSERVILLA